MSVLPKPRFIVDHELDKMRNELNQLINEKKEQEQQKKEEFTLAQQMLIMHYLGFLNVIELPNTKKAILLSKVFNRGKDQIRINLSSINSKNFKSEENLKVLLSLFQSLKMTKNVERLIVDLPKIK